MKEVINYLLQYGHLNKQQIELISKKASAFSLDKDEYLVEAGNMFNNVIFVLEGVLRICYYNQKGEEITKYFIDENHFLANPYKGEPLTEYIQAITDCKIIQFSQQDWNELYSTIVGFDRITDNIFHKGMVEKMDRRSALVSEDATTRYLTFLKLFPNLVNRIPLSYIASYLGITQQSLSRIRRNTQ